jgi:arylsulfatase A-like enzyme
LTQETHNLYLVKFQYVFIFVLLCLSCQTTEDEPKPNVIIILSDDQGWGDLSFNGNSNIQTPNIDELARQGASFTNFYVSPVCSPTRAELLTGRYNHRGGVYSTSAGGERLDLDETTIADIFKKANYKTAAYGKWHNGMQYPYHPNGRGFEDFYGFCSGHWGNYFSPILEHNGKIVKGNGFVIDDFTERGLSFIEANKEDQFFLYLPYNTPHSPMQVPEQYWNRKKDMSLEFIGTRGEEQITHTKAALAMCENIDWNVGRIVDKVEELGLTENTIILYFSDNGPNGWRWNGDMKGRKGSTDEGGVRSPLFVKWPNKIQSGLKIDRIASAIDLLPTLSELCGIDYRTEKELDGLSLKELLFEERNTNWEDRYILNHFRGRLSIRSQQYRLGNDQKLYDIQKDRGQWVDVSEQHPKIKAEMLLIAEKFRTQIETEIPEMDNRPYYLGHPDTRFTQIPARDGTAHGGIKRSNRFPNCTFFTNWKNLEDEITWKVEVPEAGNFKVVLYYTCPEEDLGATFELAAGKSKIISKITVAHDPPLQGMEHDLTERMESYVKDFKELHLGTMNLEKGAQLLKMKALDIPGTNVMDFRMLVFERLD